MITWGNVCQSDLDKAQRDRGRRLPPTTPGRMALRARGREYRAGDRLQERLRELRLRDRERAEGLALQLGELVVARARLEELALRVEDARVAHLAHTAGVFWEGGE